MKLTTSVFLLLVFLSGSLGGSVNERNGIAITSSSSINGIEAVSINGQTIVAGGYDPDAQTYFDNIVANGGTIDNSQKGYINTFVLSSKSHGTWSKLLYVAPLCGDDWGAATGLLKFVGNTEFNPHGIGGGNYGVSTGLTGNGVSSYVETDVYDTHLTANSTGIAVYDRSSAAGVESVHGTRSNGTSGFYLYATYTDNVAYSAQYNDADQIGTPTISGPIGFIHSVRPASNSHIIYRNGVSVASTSTVGGTIPNLPFMFMTLNAAGTPTGFSPNSFGFFAITTGMNATEAADFYADVQALMTSLGRNI